MDFMTKDYKDYKEFYDLYHSDKILDLKRAASPFELAVSAKLLEVSESVKGLSRALKSQAFDERSVGKIKHNILKSVLPDDFLIEIEKIKLEEDTQLEIKKLMDKQKEKSMQLEMRKDKGINQ